MGRKSKRQVHRPGSLVDQRPIAAATLARLDRISWQACPEKFALQVWAEINRLVEGK